MLPAYRNQSIDLQCKSIDWFLYVGSIEMKKVIGLSLKQIITKFFGRWESNIKNGRPSTFFGN